VIDVYTGTVVSDDQLDQQLDRERIEMTKKKKLCEICGENPATVPDRERMGRLINRVCSSCHALRLAGDMKLIFELHERRRKETR